MSCVLTCASICSRVGSARMRAVNASGSVSSQPGRVWVFALLMSLLLLIDLFVTTREIGRLRRVEAGGTP